MAVTSTVLFEPLGVERPYQDTGTGYRLDVVASGVVDVVGSAGGWLYDQRAAGWEVNVFLPQTEDLRPLQILGVRAWAWDAAYLVRRSARQALAVSAAAFAGDARVREQVRRALGHRLTGVTLWGEGWPLPVGRAVHAAEHRLSTAARAFKRHALAAAAGAHHPADAAESFLSREGLR